jgi:hypothetical protein
MIDREMTPAEARIQGYNEGIIEGLAPETDHAHYNNVAYHRFWSAVYWKCTDREKAVAKARYAGWLHGFDEAKVGIKPEDADKELPSPSEWNRSPPSSPFKFDFPRSKQTS